MTRSVKDIKALRKTALAKGAQAKIGGKNFNTSRAKVVPPSEPEARRAEPVKQPVPPTPEKTESKGLVRRAVDAMTPTPDTTKMARSIDGNTQATLKLAEEIRAQMAGQSAPHGWKFKFKRLHDNTIDEVIVTPIERVLN